jgi:glycosyltransferase involved in cell wall biosynthesis
MAKSKDGVSVIICCHNSGHVIAETLKHIYRQKVNRSIDWEVILVNNGSTDNTLAIAEKIKTCGSYGPPLKIVHQPEPGKCNALKKGLNTAEYELILICDDDNLLEEYYIQTAYGIMSNNPQIGILGGCGYPKTEGDFPPWFEQFKKYYGCGRQSKRKNDITHEKEYVYGAGSVFRKSIFKELDEHIYFRSLPGRNNNNLVGAEDNVMGYVAVISGFKIWYSDQLKFYHKIKKDRLKWEYLLNLSYSNGRAEIYLDPYTDFIRNNPPPRSWTEKIVTITKHILSLIKRNGINLFNKKEGSRKDVILHYYLGKLKELIKLNFSYKKEYQRSIRYCKIVKSKRY